MFIFTIFLLFFVITQQGRASVIDNTYCRCNNSSDRYANTQMTLKIISKSIIVVDVLNFYFIYRQSPVKHQPLKPQIR